jgi:predicted helicase
MTFVAQAATQAVREFESKYGSGGREQFVRNHILRNFCAFELMMAPYAVGHLKMSFLLEELGHKLEDDERVRFYLTNTLDMEELEQSRLPGISSLAEESHLAAEVKKQTPILVILGNPPYSGHSVNRGDWILGKIEDYKRVDGKPLGEKNPKWLQDDYVKFLRFAQWKIEQAGRGVVGMITNHSYLDNPTFRGMRQSLMQTFDEVYLLDLHGNSLKKETCPDGSKDENVFDIRQGVAIAFFIKKGKKKSGPASVRHAEQWGLRSEKYTWLSNHDLGKTKWQKLDPKSESYLFVPQDGVLKKQYESFAKMTSIFSVSNVGIVTARDSLTIQWTPDEVWRTVTVFSRMDPELARRSYGLGKDAKDWKVSLAQKDLLESPLTREKVAPILYRPFDIRHTYYTGRSGGFHCRPRPDIMRHMLAGENVALVAPKQHKQEFGAFVSSVVGAHKSVAAYDINYYFPLYLYPDGNRKDLFTHHDASEREPNLNPKFLAILTKAHRHKPTPEEVFSYTYGILYSEIYRQKYAEFLRREFPRIPFPAGRKTFKAMAALGERLIQIHLLMSHELNPPSARFEGAGDYHVAKSRGEGFRYEESEQRLYINKTQHFVPVPLEIWKYQIGGYQVCEKWLKDRRERKLDLAEIQTYCRILTALNLTIRIQKEIDDLYPNVEVDLMDLALFQGDWQEHTGP